MTQIERISFLRQLKDDLIEKFNHHSTTYTESIEITAMMRNVNMEIQSIKGKMYAESDTI